MNVAGKGQVIGYARVSTADQNDARQVEALGDVDRLFSEKISSRVRHRPQLDEALSYLRDGDTLRVKSCDRLARSTSELLSIVKGLSERGVKVEFVDTPALSTDTAQGEFMLTILAAVAQLERSLISERQREGIELAKARGTYRKRPGMSPEQIKEARALIAEGVPKAKVAQRLGFARSTLYDALNGQGRYADAVPEQTETH